MQIYCPKCHTGYQLDDKLANNKSRRLRCSNCGDVFTFGDSAQPVHSAPESDKSAFDALADMMRNDAPVIAVPDEDVMPEANTDSAVSSTPQEDNWKIADLADETEYMSEILHETKDMEEQQPGVENRTDPWLEPRTETENDPSEEQPVDEEVVVQEVPDVPEPENQTSDETVNAPVDLEKIFERLSEHTEHLIARERKLPFYERMWLGIKNVLGFHFKIKWSYIFVALIVFALLSAFNNRYQIVRKLPFLNAVYKAVGVTAKVPGEGLDFQNVGWDLVTDADGVATLEIKGFIYNQTDKAITVPTIHMEILDKDTALLQSQTRDLESVVEPNSKIPLDMTVMHPAPTSKYVYLTFIDKD